MSTFISTIKLNNEIVIENVSADVTVNNDGKFKSWYGIIFINTHIKIELGQGYEIFLDDGRSGSINFIKERDYSNGKRILEFRGMGSLN